MKTVLDFIQLCESEGATNVVSSGAIANKDVPLGQVQKRKDLKESDAYEGENPLANNAGKFPLLNATAGEADVEVEKGVTDDGSDADKRHMFHLKQQYQNDQVSHL